MNTHPNDEKPYSEDAIADRLREIVSFVSGRCTNEEAARKCLGFVVQHGEQVISALRTSSQPATPASASEDPVAWQRRENADHGPEYGQWVQITESEYRQLAKLIGDKSYGLIAGRGDTYRWDNHGWPMQIRALYTHPTLHQPPSGEWVMVPREPTIAMIVAAVKSQEGDAVYKCVSGEGLYNMEEEARCAYRAMIAAAPSQE